MFYLFRLLSVDYMATMTEILSIQQILMKDLERRGDKLVTVTKNM